MNSYGMRFCYSCGRTLVMGACNNKVCPAVATVRSSFAPPPPPLNPPREDTLARAIEGLRDQLAHARERIALLEQRVLELSCERGRR